MFEYCTPNLCYIREATVRRNVVVQLIHMFKDAEHPDYTRLYMAKENFQKHMQRTRPQFTFLQRDSDARKEVEASRSSAFSRFSMLQLRTGSNLLDQFSARVVYGLPVFMTITPSERHSGLIIRLSRYRRNDPGIQDGYLEFEPWIGWNRPSLQRSEEENNLETVE